MSWLCSKCQPSLAGTCLPSNERQSFCMAKKNFVLGVVYVLGQSPGKVATTLNPLSWFKLIFQIPVSNFWWPDLICPVPKLSTTFLRLACQTFMHIFLSGIQDDLISQSLSLLFKLKFVTFLSFCYKYCWKISINIICFLVLYFNIQIF